ncbi:EamA family transporter [Phormidesmis sp. 146-12]
MPARHGPLRSAPTHLLRRSTVLPETGQIGFALARHRAIAAGLMAALFYVIAAPYAKRQLSGVLSLVIATMSQLSVAVFLLPALPFTVPKIAPTAIIILSVFALALFSIVVAYILYFRLIQNVGSTKALKELTKILDRFWRHNSLISVCSLLYSIASTFRTAP